jgi:flagellar biosynthesis anti-sigma factor FlgM
MRIDLNQSAQALPEGERVGNQSASASAAQIGAASALGEDQAQLSGVHLQVQTLTTQALQLPEVRQEKVNALRQVVQDRNYQPSSDRIADSIFQHMLVMPAA